MKLIKKEDVKIGDWFVLKATRKNRDEYPALILIHYIRTDLSHSYILKGKYENYKNINKHDGVFGIETNINYNSDYSMWKWYKPNEKELEELQKIMLAKLI